MTKQEKIDYYIDILALEDEITVMELLDIKSADIAERFQDYLVERLEYIESYFDEENSIDAMMSVITGDKI